MESAAELRFSRTRQAVVQSHGAPGVMPTRKQLGEAGRFDLYWWVALFSAEMPASHTLHRCQAQ